MNQKILILIFRYVFTTFTGVLAAFVLCQRTQRRLMNSIPHQYRTKSINLHYIGALLVLKRNPKQYHAQCQPINHKRNQADPLQ